MDDNLEQHLVARDFWPACSNCEHAQACKTRPQHPAYPHAWHWSRDAVSFPEGELILQSWVGTAASGQPHTGCPRYAVDPQYTTELSPHHQHYLTLEAERRRIDAESARLERKECWTTREEETFAHLLARYKQILAQQAARRSPVLQTDLLALSLSA